MHTEENVAAKALALKQTPTTPARNESGENGTGEIWGENDLVLKEQQ